MRRPNDSTTLVHLLFGEVRSILESSVMTRSSQIHSDFVTQFKNWSDQEVGELGGLYMLEVMECLAVF